MVDTKRDALERIAVVLVPCFAVACGSGKHETTPVIPPDHQLHTTVTPEEGGSHIQISGRAVPLKDLLPASLLLPVVGDVDVVVDLHVPGHDGQLDYRGATGEATMRCAYACAIALDPLSAGPTAPPPRLAPVAIDAFDARVVFAHGSADVAKWTVVGHDLRFEVTGHLALAPALADSTASVCVRFGKPSSKLTPSSRLAQTFANANIAIDASGLMNIKLSGRAGALEVVDFGCDGQTRPPPLPPEELPPVADEGIEDTAAEIEHEVAKRSDTAYDVNLSLIDRLLANPMAAGDGARITPDMRSGKPRGFKLSKVRQTSLFAKLGLADGDLLLALDGHDLATVDDALTAFTSLHGHKAGDQLVLSIERRGKPVTLTYTLR